MWAGQQKKVEVVAVENFEPIPLVGGFRRTPLKVSVVICSLKDRLRKETARHFRISSTQAHRKRSRYVRLRFSIYIIVQFKLLFFGIYCKASSST